MSLCLTKDAPECECKSEMLHDSYLVGRQDALRSEESSGLMSLKITEMGEKPDQLLASDRVNVVSGNQKVFLSWWLAPWWGWETAFLESYPFSLLIAAGWASGFVKTPSRTPPSPATIWQSL